MNKPDKDSQARDLAQKHYQIEPGLVGIFRLMGEAQVEQKTNEPIKLLEVNQNTIPSGMHPLHFDPVPASGIHYPTVIIEVTPAEYEVILRQPDTLPHGWRISEEIKK